MRVDMTFDQQKVEQQGYTLAAVRQTVQKNFAAHGLHCVQTVSYTHLTLPTTSRV